MGRCGETERWCRARAVSAFADSLCHRSPNGGALGGLATGTVTPLVGIGLALGNRRHEWGCARCRIGFWLSAGDDAGCFAPLIGLAVGNRRHGVHSRAALRLARGWAARSWGYHLAMGRTWFSPTSSMRTRGAPLTWPVL